MDRRTEKILDRRKACKQTGDCDRCPPHRGENRERVARRSWKLRTKKKRKETK